MRQVGGSRYWSLERNPEFAAVISSLIDLAGLSDIVKVIVGPSDASLRRLHKQGALSSIDLMFLDHYKPAYLYDLKLCEQLHLVSPGSVLAADNVIKPGNPPYLAYVRSSVAEKRAALGASEGDAVAEGFSERTAKQYEKREGQEHLNAEVLGDPGLVYQSVLVNSWEPTGVPVSPGLVLCFVVWFKELANMRRRMVSRLRDVLERRSGLRRCNVKSSNICVNIIVNRHEAQASFLNYNFFKTPSRTTYMQYLFSCNFRKSYPLQ